MFLQGFTKLSPNFSRKLSLKKHVLKYYEKVLRGFLGDFFVKLKMQKIISETLQKYFTKGYKESI